MAIWTMKGKSHYWCSSVDEAVEVASKQKGDTYFTMGLYPMDCKNRLQNNVECIFGVWLDIDVGDKGKGAKYFPTMEDAIIWVEDALAGMHTHIIHSGGGLHVYLMFDEPFWITNSDEREIARILVRKYWNWANEQTEYTIDPLTDLSRIMRLPGTKHTGKGETCHVVTSNETVASYSDLMERLPSVTLPDESGQVAGTDGECSIATVKHKLMLLQEADVTFSKTWRRLRRFSDETPSGYCMSIANQLCVAGFNDSEIQAALEMWREGQLDAKRKGTDWYTTTIKKARQSTSAQQNEIKFERELTMAALDPDEGESKDTASLVFGVELLSVVKNVTPEYKGRKEKVSYTLSFEGNRNISVPSSTVLMNQTAMRELLMEELGIIMKRLKGPQYDNLLKILLGMMEEKTEPVEGNLAFTIEQELQSFVNTKIENQEVEKVLSEWQRSFLFEDDTGILYFSWQAFKIRLSNSGIKAQNKEIASILVALGSEPKQFPNKQRTRLWSVPDDI